ncbi:OLC1v1031686C1, partial [Oldenlandia corymbosa var. corymbosa]
LFEYYLDVVSFFAPGDSIPSVPQGSKPLHLLPKPQKSIMVVGLEINVSKVSSQLRVARPPVEA